MEPHLYYPKKSFFHSLMRLYTAIFVDCRLPHRVALWIDRWQIGRGSLLKTISLRGLKLTVRRGTSDFHMACGVLAGEYFRPGFEIGRSDTVIDVGGNIGAFALAASMKAPLGSVYTFEPSRDSYALLVNNIAQNNVKNVIAIRAAVSDSEGTLVLHVDGLHTGRSSIDVDHAGTASSQELVPTLSLQRVFDEYGIQRCDFLKLDCEGAEYAILYALPLEYHKRIQRIAMEYHGGYSMERRHAKARELVGHLVASGYEVTDWIDNACSDCGWIFATRQNMPR